MCKTRTTVQGISTYPGQTSIAAWPYLLHHCQNVLSGSQILCFEACPKSRCGNFLESQMINIHPSRPFDAPSVSAISRTCAGFQPVRFRSKTRSTLCQASPHPRQAVHRACFPPALDSSKTLDHCPHKVSRLGRSMGVTGPTFHPSLPHTPKANCRRQIQLQHVLCSAF